MMKVGDLRCVLSELKKKKRQCFYQPHDRSLVQTLFSNTHQFLSPVLRAQEGDRKVTGFPNDRREQEEDREGRR